jgi:S-adenosylmethionine:tRNA ribosyltransferase-isomerase
MGIRRDITFPVSKLDYHLPEELIAQSPLEKRDDSRLLVCSREKGTIEHHVFRELPDLINKRAVIAINNSRVFPAKTEGIKETGGKIELLFLREEEPGKWRVIFSRRSRMPEDRKVFLFDNRITATLAEKIVEGKDIMEIDNPALFRKLLEEKGTTPLPPYIKNTDIDPDRYQTVYAEKSGSSAAPTAGLHFTEELMAKMKGRGFRFAQIELQIGLDTFSPVREENLLSHNIHTEYGVLAQETAKILSSAKNLGYPVCAIGTTTTRLIEYIAKRFGRIQPFRGDVDLFIIPGHNFRAIDILVTNFHLPRTTLLALVASFMGLEFMFEAYSKAIENKYRFYSFGDAMLII